MFANLELPQSLYDRLQHQAKQRQLDIVALIEQLLGSESNDPDVSEEHPTPNVFQRIGAMAQDLGVDDLSINHDHYIYGVDKRE